MVKLFSYWFYSTEGNILDRILVWKNEMSFRSIKALFNRAEFTIIRQKKSPLSPSGFISKGYILYYAQCLNGPGCLRFRLEKNDGSHARI